MIPISTCSISGSAMAAPGTAPTARPARTGRGRGDNLYLSSIVAIRPSTGEYVWHYQTTPGETWDFTATQHIMLADMEIGGKLRKVLMQAPKNGFFYVIDRETGKFISAKPYVTVNWATGIDPATGRPIENPATRVDKTGQPALVTPGALGGHNWHPMAFSPKEKLVYIPAFEAGMMYAPEANWKPDRNRGFNVGFNLGAGDLPPDGGFRKQVAGSLRGMLVAWDPVAQKARWTVEHPGPWNGGLLATGGGLVFQGTAAASSTPMTRPTARSCGALPPRPAWSRRPSPTPSMASNMSRCWRAGAGPMRCRSTAT